jgi:hypothetical protein
MCELLKSTVVVIETSNKCKYQIYNPKLLVKQPRIRDNMRVVIQYSHLLKKDLFRIAH